MQPEILIADDEPDIRALFSMVFRRRGWQCHEAGTGAEALHVVRSNSTIGIVFIDINMPDQTGLECMARIKGEDKERNLEFVIITGNAGVQEAVIALRLGAADFLTKPIRTEQIWKSLDKCLQRFQASEEQQILRKSILAEIGSKNTRIHKLAQEVDAARIESLETLAMAAEHRDNETGEHIRRIGAFSRVLAKELGWPAESLEQIGRAAQLHDIGKIGVPDRVLLKSGPLTPDEWAVMKRHAEVGSGILRGARGDAMQCAAKIALAHHERWDGTGYPHGIAGDDIPIEARIVAICDVYDALRSHRPYKPEMDHATAVRIMLEGDGRTRPEHFDPNLLDVFVKTQQTFANLYAQHPDGQPPAAPSGSARED